MKFRTEESSPNQAITSSIAPEHCREFVIPFANVTYTEGPFGGILSQKIKGNNYDILQHHFFIKEAINLFAFTAKPIINYMLEGTLVAKLEGADDVLFRAGYYQMFYMQALNLELRLVPGNYHCVQITFDPSYLKKLISGDETEPQQIFPHVSGKINAKTKVILSDMIQSKVNSGVHDLQLQLEVLELLLQVIKKHYSFNNSTGTERFLALERFINDNLEKPLSVEALAQFCRKSQSELHRLFKLHFKKSPHHFIQERRIEKAMEFIKSTDFPISHIAQMVGFEDISSFNKAFKKQYTASPSNFR